MAESIAASVIHTLPRHITGKGKAPLVQAVKSASRPSLAKNFFTPIPRRAMDQTPADQTPLDSVLDYRAWAYPMSKQCVWSEDGSMRSLLLTELLPKPAHPAGRRARRASQSSRARSRKLSSLSSPVDRSKFSTSAPVHAQLQPKPHIPLAHRKPEEDFDSKSALSRFREHLKTRAKTNKELQSLQTIYEQARNEGAFSSLPHPELLDLASDFANFIDHLCADQVHADVIERWGLRLQELLEYLPSGSTPTPNDDFRNSLSSRAWSYVGDLYKAEQYIRRSPVPTPPRFTNHLTDFQRASLSYILSFSRHKDLYHALHYAFVLRPSYFSGVSDNTLFQTMIIRSLSLLDVPALASKWPKEAYNTMVIEVVKACNVHNEFKKSIHFLEYQMHPQIYTSPIMLRTVSGLATSGNIKHAQRLYDMIPSGVVPEDNSIKLLLRARGSDFASAEDMLAKRDPGKISDAQISHVLYPYAERGMVRELEAVFDRFFPLGPDGVRTRKPNVFHYSTVVQAYARKGDADGLGALLEDMRVSEVEPNIQLMTNILSIYRKKGDIAGALNTYQYMRRIGLSLDTVVYTVVIALLANAKDSVTAAQIYMQAIDDGIVPDDTMTNALMNAYVETGTLKEAVAIFHHLTALDADLLPPIDTFNTILKGYVLYGAPFRLISKLFFKLQKVGAKPNTYTFATLVLSATDAGELDIAHGIYEEMKNIEEESQTSLISEHVLTILLSAYLQRRIMDKARDILNEMTERGHPPTPVTYRAIIASYGGKHWESKMQIAEEFVKKVQQEEHVDTNYQKRPSLVHFYMPLIVQYCNKGNVAEVERLYTAYLDAGGEPSYVLLEHLLRCYWQANDVQNVMAVWQVIRELAESETIDDGVESGSKMETPFGKIHFSLSMFIDIMSKSGLHAEVAKAWSDLQRSGFEFDSHNWNHLTVALIRAGQVERAFEVVETILLPRGREVIEAAELLQSQELPDLSAKLQIAESIDPTPAEPPLRDRKKRTQVVSEDKLQRFRQVGLVEDDEAIDADFVYPLQILQIISPQFNTWRPHTVVLRTLLIVVLQLQRGYPIRPIRTGEVFQNNVSGSEMTEQDFTATEETLHAIYTKYPETSLRVRNFQARETQRISKESFDAIYLRR
ncbi:Putative pentatricopeptide repeat-containing protein [Psilocybe cubensis]|uniref:Pentatricopeptide repeat-containing protein n=2 Tax=Psilocybe cubensis TaxID=181762 RepID=A0ACB8H3W1_PSICU|nr:Putative pentatricopeptide repeat-containing protein [Psilocybe cubensis]KAH9482529.1 Putative pentatricopeptide repeat-containing protein [Psilocybe cubensis]